eukprot:2760636-Pleurochrysis_carterae.AAC.1
MERVRDGVEMGCEMARDLPRIDAISRLKRGAHHARSRKGACGVVKTDLEECSAHDLLCAVRQRGFASN